MILYLAVIGLVASGIVYTSYQSVSLQNSVRLNNSIMANQQVAGEAKRLLIEDISRINNSSEFFVPAGDNSFVSYTTLPSYFENKRLSSGGVPFLYCPTSGVPISTGSGNVGLPNGNSYGIDTTPNPARSGYEYVTGSSFQKDNVLAFIVSPIGNRSTLPSCTDITKTQGVYTVSGGQVFTVTEADVIANKQSNTVIEARVNPSHTNDASLEDGTELQSRSLTTNIERFKNSTVKEMVVYLEAGTYDLPAGTLEANGIESKRLSLVGNGSVVINTPTINMKGVDISLRGVDTTADVAINTSRLTLDDAEAGSITARGGDITARESRVVGSTTINGSTLRVTDAFDFGQVQALSGSRLDFIDANGTIEGSSFGLGILGSTVSMDGSTVAISGTTAINNQGEVIVWNSTVTTTGATYGILSSNGGINRISNSDMFLSGTQPTYAFVDDNGTALVAGNGSFSGGQCFEGEIFEELATISIPEGGTYTVPNPNNQATWACL